MVEEFKEKFTGKWKLDRSENFEEFLSVMGLNFMIRKMASLAKPENIISVEDDGTVVIINNSTFMKSETRFKLGEAFEEMNQQVKKLFRNMPTYSDGKLRTVPTPVKPTNDPYPEYVDREINAEGEMVVTIQAGSVVCKRIFKKVE